MKIKFIVISVILLVACSIGRAQVQLQITNDSIPLVHYSDEGVSLIDFRDILTDTSDICVIYCANWCPPSYEEFNRLYNSKIIDFLLSHNVRLVIVSDKLPFLHLNSPKIKGDWADRIDSDFEIHYDIKMQFCEFMNSSTSFPQLWILRNRTILWHSDRLQQSYSKIFELYN